VKIFFKIEGKIFSRHTKIEGICGQSTCPVRNVKGSLKSRKSI
jgi:hypothetical protein